MNPQLPENDTKRLAWIRQCGILDSPEEPAFDDVTRLAAEICSVPIAAISIVDEDRQWFKSIVGLEVRETPRDVAFCAHTILQSEVLVVEDAEADARFADNPLVTGDPGIRFYAGAPITTSDGMALGSLCVIDRTPKQLTSQQTAILQVLASQIAGRIELQRRIALQDQLIAERSQAREACKHAEASYRNLFENAAEGIFRTSPQGQFVSANPALARIYGYESPLQMMTEIADVSAQVYVESGRRAMFELAVRTDAPVVGFESQIRRRDGSVTWISESARPVYDQQGQIMYYEGFVQEISDRKALETQREHDLSAAQLRADLDPLTELWNHRAFHKQVAQQLAGNARRGSSSALVLFDIDNFKLFNDTYGYVAGDAVLRMVAEHLEAICHDHDVLARFGGDKYAMFIDDLGSRSQICLRVGMQRDALEADMEASLSSLVFVSQKSKMDVPIRISLGSCVSSDGKVSRQEMVEAADERLRRSKAGGATLAIADEIRAFMKQAVEGFSMLDSLVAAVDNKDRYTRRHSEDVMAHCLTIARHMGLDETFQHTLAVAALLHDVGKIGVPDAVLRKPGKLTDAEYTAIKQHPMMGAAIVSAVPGFEDMLDAVRYHHERYDGEGYPLRLRGEQTPIIARIMAVADAYSAMTTDRPYRNGMEESQVRSILADGAGTQWDPHCVEALLLARASAKPLTIQANAPGPTHAGQANAAQHLLSQFAAHAA